MAKSLIVQTTDSRLNAALLTALLPVSVLRDYRIQENGIYCIFNSAISNIQEIIKEFLSGLYEVTGTIFYYEIINKQEAILKIYGIDRLQFSQKFLYQSSEIDRF